MVTHFTLAGESNPNWQIAEPLLLKIWSRGILAAGTLQLYIVFLMAWGTALVFFLFGFSIRCAVLLAVGYIFYLLFPEASSTALSLIFTSVPFDHPQPVASPWKYELGGYILMFAGVFFLLTGSFADFVRDSLLYVLVLLGGMLPLKWLAHGLANGNYWAQLIAKKPFMGVHLVQTITAAPDHIVREWDWVFSLYMNSNDESARKKLQALAGDNNPESRE